MSTHYDVYNNESNCFEIEYSGPSNFILTMDDNVFDSAKYDEKTRGKLRQLWDATRRKYEFSK